MNNLLTISTFILGGFAISTLSIPIVIKLITQKGALTHPNHRTSHTVATPSFGGIGIFGGLLITLPFLEFNLKIFTLLTASAVLFFAGMRDDLIEMKSLTKLMFQIACAVGLYFSGFELNSLHGILGFWEIPQTIGFILTVIFIVGVTNAFNLIDGINGLAGSISLINTLVFGIVFLMNRETSLAIIAFAISGTILGFLRHNFNPAKIFMGDTGSLFLGLLMSTFALKTMQLGNVGGFETPLVITLLFVPVFDTIRLFIKRMMNKQSPFTADRNHLHHLVLEVSPMHHRATIIITMLHASIIASTLFASFFSTTALILIATGLMLSFFSAIKLVDTLSGVGGQKSIDVQ